MVQVTISLLISFPTEWLLLQVVKTMTTVTPQMTANLGYKIFITFVTVNVGAMATFSLLLP